MINWAKSMADSLEDVDRFREYIGQRNMNIPVGYSKHSRGCVMYRYLRYIHGGMDIQSLDIVPGRVYVKIKGNPMQQWDTDPQAWYNKLIDHMDANCGTARSHVFRTQVEAAMDHIFITEQAISDQLNAADMIGWARGLDGFEVIAKAKTAAACPISVYLQHTLRPMYQMGVFTVGQTSVCYQARQLVRMNDGPLINDVLVPTMPLWARAFVHHIDRLGRTDIKRDDIINVLLQVAHL